MAGTPRDISYLENRFKTGDKPTQQDFYDVFASFIHYLKVQQVTGSSQSDLMSQKAVTDALTALNRTLAEVLSAGNNAGGMRIVNILNPIDPQDADTKAARDAAIASAIATAVANLLDSAPGALDTLNELAAALGDDPAFAATVINSLALKAPVDSPALTGVPMAPTAPPGTNTAQIATTAYVLGAIALAVVNASDTVRGIVKLYDTTIGANTDGAPSQAAVNTSIGGIQQDQETLKIYKISNFGTP